MVSVNAFICSRLDFPTSGPPSFYFLCLVQDVKPDFLSGEYFETIREALALVDGRSPSDQPPGQVFSLLFRKAFSGHLESRSHNMVGRVKTYMQSVLQTLLEDACEDYPALLDKVKSLVQEYMEDKEERTVKAVSNAVKAELDWVVTHPAYTTSIAGVCHMVHTKREIRSGSEVSVQTQTACGSAKDQDIRSIQVAVSRSAHSNQSIQCHPALNLPYMRLSYPVGWLYVL